MKTLHERMRLDMEGQACLGDGEHEHAIVALNVVGIVVSRSLGTQRLSAYRAVHMLDPAGCIIGWSTGAELLTGYHAEEVIANHYRMLFRWEDRMEGFPSWQLQRALLHARIEESGWLLRKDGSTVWVNFVLGPIYSLDGSHVGFIRMTRDSGEGSACMADGGVERHRDQQQGHGDIASISGFRGEA